MLETMATKKPCKNPWATAWRPQYAPVKLLKVLLSSFLSPRPRRPFRKCVPLLDFYLCPFFKSGLSKIEISTFYLRTEDIWYEQIYFERAEPFTLPLQPGYCKRPLFSSFFFDFFFTGNVQHHLFFFCHPIAAAPLPNLFPACSSLSKPFIMTAIHNTSPSAGFYFPCRPVTASSSYPTASPRLSLSLTLSPPWPLRSQRIHSLPFVSAQSKQAATEGGGGERVSEGGIIERERKMNEEEERRGESWLKWGNCIKTVLCPSHLPFYLFIFLGGGWGGGEIVDVGGFSSDTSRWEWKDR